MPNRLVWALAHGEDGSSLQLMLRCLAVLLEPLHALCAVGIHLLPDLAVYRKAPACHVCVNLSCVTLCAAMPFRANTTKACLISPWLLLTIT